MSTKLSIPHLILVFVILFSACGGHEKKGNENNALPSSTPLSWAIGEKYVVDKKGSVIIYKGSMVLASKGSHTGYVYLSNGELLIDKGRLISGSVVVDMNTIADIKHGSENDLVRHLKSPDFFDVAQFPTATFFITMIPPANGETINVTGNLTIKGITHAITFPAKIEVKDGIVNANAKITIDRTRWDVRYNSQKFFSNLADEVISDDIELDMKIVAKKSGAL